MTEPAAPPKPLTAADKGWTGKIDAGIEDLIRSIWLLLSFPVAAPLRFLQWRRPAALALAEARSAGQLLPPLLALGLALFVLPQLLDSLLQASDSFNQARSVMERELSSRLDKLGSDLLTRAAPLLIATWLAAQLMARPLAWLTGQTREHMVNQSLYLLAITASIIPLLLLSVMSVIAVPGQGDHGLRDWVRWLFLAPALLGALVPIAATAHSMAGAWRHAQGSSRLRRALMACSAALCTILMAVMLPAAKKVTHADAGVSAYRLVAQWFFPPDRHHQDDDSLIEVVARQCQLDTDPGPASLRCSLLLKGLGNRERFVTDARDAAIELVQTNPQRTGDDGMIPTTLQGKFPVTALTQPALQQGVWLNLKPGAFAPLTVRLGQQDLCKALTQVAAALKAAPAASTPDGSLPRGSMLRLTTQAFVHEAGVSSGGEVKRLVLIPSLMPAVKEVGLKCTNNAPTPP